MSCSWRTTCRVTFGGMSCRTDRATSFSSMRFVLRLDEFDREALAEMPNDAADA